MSQEFPNEENGKENGTLDEGAQAASAGTSEEAPQATVQPQGPSTEALLEEWKNRAAYLAAEMDNMRKRFIRDRADIIKSANEDLLKGILPVYDNLFLAIRSIRESAEKKQEQTASGVAEKLFENLLKGVEMTFNHFEQTLDRFGVKAVDAVGKEFNPSVHEAVGQSSDANYADNVVTAELQRGFQLNERVIRTARVIVNKVNQS